MNNKHSNTQGSQDSPSLYSYLREKTRTHLQPILMIMLIGLLLGSSVHAQVPPESSNVRIPWDEFRKLLQLDKDEFVLSWEEFQLILQQTGFKYVPSFQLKDEKVILTRDQFKQLLKQMKPPKEDGIQPPADFLLTRAVYRGRISGDAAQFHAAYAVEIFERQRNQFIHIPFFPVNIALKNASFDGNPALIVLAGNRHTLTTRETGRHAIDLDFSLKAAAEQGPGAVNFPIPLTAVTVLEFDIPFKNIDVEITNAQEVEVSERGNMTHVYALLSPSNTIHLRWRKRPQEIEKGPAKVYAETLNLLSIEDAGLRVSSDISLSILHNTISALNILVPSGYNVLDVRGSGIQDWREVTQNGASYLEILFEYPKKGNFTLSLTAEKIFPDDTIAVDFSGFAVPDAVREKGFLGVELKSASGVTLADLEGLDKLDVSELPPSLINRSRKPLLLGFKYLRHPYSMVLDIKKHTELPVIGTVIDSASGVSLVTEDGKLVHRIVYLVRNTSKQFLELELPEAAQIWTVFVGGEPAKPRLSGSKILIPLNRSASGAAGLEAFDVELIYFQRSDRFGWSGRGESMFPVPDIIISQMLWSVYLPEGHKFIHFGGSVEKEKTAQGLRLLLGSRGNVHPTFPPQPQTPEEAKGEMDRYRREAGKVKEQFSANLALTEEQLIEQIENEARFSQRVQDIQSGQAPSGAGILPIRIQIPATGQLFRFAKTIVSEEPLTLSYVSLSNGLLWLLRVAASVIMVGILAFFRRRIMKSFRKLLKKYRNTSRSEKKN